MEINPLRTPQEELVYWITERESIRHLKEVEKVPKPWTTDPVMQVTYFCNVHREDDRVTRWIRQKWHGMTSLSSGPMENAEPNMCMARLVNRIESLDDLCWPWQEFDPSWFKSVAEVSKPFWGNAYVVTTHGQKMSKIDYACGVLEKVFDHPWDIAREPSLASWHKEICKLEGFGSFMAAQVIADLKHTPEHPLYVARDWWSWSAHGPGSLRGLCWVFDTKVTPGAYKEAIQHAWNMVKKDVPKMSMQDFQNCLCEFDKYMRVKNHTGKSKRSYNGSA